MRTLLLLGVGLAACSSAVVDPTAPPLVIAHGAEPATASGSDAKALAAVADRLFARALDENQAIVHLRDLLVAAPKRLSGSPGSADAVVFAAARLAVIGCERVRTEPILVPQWVRGVETASVLQPRAMPLRVTALGGSIATPPDGLRAEIVMVRSFEQLAAMGAAARGKIVFFNRPMPRVLARTFQAYGDAVPQRSSGAIEAAKVGAIAALVRSVTTAIDGFPHTGAMNYQDGVAKVPAAAVATADAEALAAMLATGPVTIELVLGCETRADVPSANVVGEVRGRELPDEVVVIGGHLDAWDLGAGAHDDGAGCAEVIEALRLLRTTGTPLRRTVRGVLFMNEENGLRGGLGYAAAHAHERHVAAIETDGGGATPQGFSCSLAADAAAPLRALFAPLEVYGAGAFLAGGGGGADISPLQATGTPLFGLISDGQRYCDYHHPAAETIDKVNERVLALGAAALAYAASVLANQ